MRHSLCLLLGSLMLVGWSAAVGLASPGDLIATVPLPVTGFDVSVAVDCDGNVYYTQGDTNLYKMDKDGNLLDTIPLTDSVSGAPLDMDELAYDQGRDVFWAQLHGSTPVSVYHIDRATGVCTFQWVSATNSVGTYRDGIAYDASDDTVWISGDVSTTIEHYMANGALIGAITPLNAAGSPLGLISGITVGVGDLMYCGRNGAVEIVQVRKSDGTFIASFASPGGSRDEGLECDPINFFPLLALWSRDVDNFMTVIELEPGTCACAGQQNNPPQFEDSPCGQILMASAGVPFSYTVTAVDIDGDIVTLDATGVPAGATHTPALPAMGNPVSTQFDWTPGNGDVGTHIVVYSANDGTDEVLCRVVIEVAECHLLLAHGTGAAEYSAGGYTYSTQLSNIRRSFPVTMEDNPSIPLSYFLNHAQGGPAGPSPWNSTFTPPAAGAPSGSTSVAYRFYTQVVMFNPEVFPENPEQSTRVLQVTILTDWTAYGRLIGQRDGMDVSLDVFYRNGRPFLRFPFRIDGM